MHNVYRTFTDGGARGNPGPAAFGAVIHAPNDTVHTIKKYIGVATNNQAEYRGLVAALEYLAGIQAEAVDCYLDSELLVKQMRREYRVKDTELGKLFLQAWKYASTFKHVSFHHIPREKNKAADRLVNEALDEALSRG